MPELPCWLPAYTPLDDFSLENIPFGAGVLPDSSSACCVTRINTYIISLNALADAGLLDDLTTHAGLSVRSAFTAQSTLNAFMALGRPAWRSVRTRIQELFTIGGRRDIHDDESLQSKVMHDASQVKMTLPCTIGDYTDFYCSKEHATNVGVMFRGGPPEKALMENWKTMPVGYHGRASSVVVSGTPVVHPSGQLRPDPSADPTHGPCRIVDFELEMAVFVGTGNDMGTSIGVDEAEDKIFGMTLMNDWSARDVQKYEYVPLGPFGAKNWATTISPWIVTLDALAPFRTNAPVQDLAPVLPYLTEKDRHTFDIGLKVAIEPASGEGASVVCRSNYKHLYWTAKQMLAHHTVTGCNMRPGDLFASGTISGSDASSFGSMLELSWQGTRPLDLGNGVTRTFVQDGDNVVMTGCAQGDGFRVGFGTCEGHVMPAASGR